MNKTTNIRKYTISQLTAMFQSKPLTTGFRTQTYRPLMHCLLTIILLCIFSFPSLADTPAPPENLHLQTNAAAFEDIYTLTVESGSGDGKYQAGEVVEIEADAPGEGQVFAEWSGDLEYVEDKGSAITSLRMPEGDVQVVAGYGNTYYVSPDGDDSNPGTEDEPWQTLDKAGDSAELGDKVLFMEGVYKAPLFPQNSGTENAWITFKGMEGHEVIIEGGYEVTDWKKHEGNIYVADWDSSWLGAEWATDSWGGSNGFVNVGLIGAGGYAANTLLPIIKELSGKYKLHTIVNRGGKKAVDIKERQVFKYLRFFLKSLDYSCLYCVFD